MAFIDDDVSTSETPETKKVWIEEVGTYWYYSLILANFNPDTAERIFDNPADVIAEAYVSMKCYQWSPKKGKYGR